MGLSLFSVRDDIINLLLNTLLPIFVGIVFITFSNLDRIKSNISKLVLRFRKWDFRIMLSEARRKSCEEKRPKQTQSHPTSTRLLQVSLPRCSLSSNRRGNTWLPNGNTVHASNSIKIVIWGTSKRLVVSGIVSSKLSNDEARVGVEEHCDHHQDKPSVFLRKSNWIYGKGSCYFLQISTTLSVELNMNIFHQYHWLYMSSLHHNEPS